MKLTRQILTVGLALFCSSVLASAIPGRAEVKKVTGSATVSQGAGAATTLAAGMVLGTGDTINTTAGSTVDLWLGLNGDVLRVEPETTLKLDQLDVTQTSPPLVNTKLNVTKGGVTANVITKLAAASRYEVRTVNGVAGIRGTIYNVGVGTGASVIHGAVSWTPTGGVVVNLFSGQGANTTSTPSAIGAALGAQVIASVGNSTAVSQPTQLAQTVNTLAQAVATSAAAAVLNAGGTQAQAAAAAASASQQAVGQIVNSLQAAYGNLPIVAQMAANTAQTTVAAAAIGAATAVAASGGTAAQAQAAAQNAGGAAATATGGTVTAAITLVANTAATTTVLAVQSGQSAAAAATASVAASSTATTQTVTTSVGTGAGQAVGATVVEVTNPLTVSGSQ